MTNVFDFNLRHLDAALAIERCGSISGGSVAVNLSQPALTQALAKLEGLLGHPLFDRQPRGVTPSAAGRLFLPRAQRAIGQIIEAGVVARRSARLGPVAHLERRVGMAQLRALSAVERSGSYALAAREIGLSQPSVHRAANELELILGIPLLVRAGRTMRATGAAERFVRAIRLAMAELQAGLDELAAIRTAGAGRIVIGTLALPRSSLLPKAIARFARRHSHADVSIVEGGYAELLAHLRDGGIDILLGALRHPAPVRDVVQHALFADDMSIVASAGHPLAGERMPTRVELARFPWVIGTQGAPMRAQWESMFPQDGGPRAIMTIESSSILVARGLLVEDDWLALMSHDQFRIEQDAGMLAAVGPPLPGSRRSIGVVTRSDWRPTATQAAFLAVLDHVAGERRRLPVTGDR